jgi:hypothetical protein
VLHGVHRSAMRALDPDRLESAGCHGHCTSERQSTMTVAGGRSD